MAGEYAEFSEHECQGDTEGVRQAEGEHKEATADYNPEVVAYVGPHRAADHQLVDLVVVLFVCDSLHHPCHEVHHEISS